MKTDEQKAARANYMREWRAANRERAREISRKSGHTWRQKSGNQAKDIARAKAWRTANPEKYATHVARRDPLPVRLRTRIYHAIRFGLKGGSAVRDLGCSIEYLRGYLAGQFEPGMTWDNWTTNGWHIDHIQPLASFDLTDPEQFRQAAHYTNLQPLWAADNFSKGAR